MSGDLRDLIKNDLGQIPVPSSDRWVPQGETPRLAARRTSLSWFVVAPAVVVVVIAALVAGGELAAFRQRASDVGTAGASARAVYLAPSENGSNWTRIDPQTLADRSTTPLMNNASTGERTYATLVSADGSTILVSHYGSGIPHWSVYDGRTGRLLHEFDPAQALQLDAISADGTLAIGRVGALSGPLDAPKVIVSVSDGHVVRAVPVAGLCECVHAVLYAPDVSAVYYVTDETVTLDTLVPVPLSVRVQSTTTGKVSDAVSLPGIKFERASTLDRPASSSVTLLQPGIAITPDGTRIMALSHDAQTLSTLDTRTLEATSVALRRQSSLLDLLRPLVAEAKQSPDNEFWSLAITPDARTVIAYLTWMRYPEFASSPLRVTRETIRIDVDRALIAATNRDDAGIYSSALLPDGSGLLALVNLTPEGAPDTWRLRRLDISTLEVKVERTLAGFVYLQLLAE